MDTDVMIEMITQYGAMGIIIAVTLLIIKQMSNQMMKNNEKIMQYFMDSNTKTNESMTNSMITIVQCIQKNADTLVSSKHDILNSNVELLKEIKEIKIDRCLMDESLAQSIVLREKLEKLLKDNEEKIKDPEE